MTTRLAGSAGREAVGHLVICGPLSAPPDLKPSLRPSFCFFFDRRRGAHAENVRGRKEWGSGQSASSEE